MIDAVLGLWLRLVVLESKGVWSCEQVLRVAADIGAVARPYEAAS